jgi:hypothetical protein
MSSKSDRDNRSNQLNPNNDRYNSSRESSRHGDDDDEDRPQRHVACIPMPRPASRSATYGFGAVTMSGKAVYVTANFHATANLCAIEPDRDCQYKFEMYLEDFTRLARGHLEGLLGKEELALFAVFDSSTGRLPWHLCLLRNDMETTGDGLNLSRCEFVAPALRALVPESAESKMLSKAFSAWTGAPPKPSSSQKEKELDPEPFFNALRKALSADARCIGEFQVPHTGRISLAEKNAIHQLA